MFFLRTTFHDVNDKKHKQENSDGKEEFGLEIIERNIANEVFKKTNEKDKKYSTSKRHYLFFDLSFSQCSNFILADKGRFTDWISCVVFCFQRIENVFQKEIIIDSDNGYNDNKIQKIVVVSGEI